LKTTAIEPEAAFVFSSHCDQLRRSFDALPAPQRDRAFLFNLPATCQSHLAEKMYRAELLRLGEFLVRFGGRQPSDLELRTAIEKGQQSRAELNQRIVSLRGRELAESLADYFAFGTGAGPRALAQSPSAEWGESIPLALVGGPLLQSHWHIFDTIERLGGQVVLLATEPGERNLWNESVDTQRESASDGALSSEKMIEALVRSYVTNTVEVYQRPNTRLYSWLGERLRSRGVQGILLWQYTWCDLWRAEAQSLKEAFKLPVLQFDADTIGAPMLARSGRIEAFMESLR
jgi:benzoyl-CoA reductase/2-hydroxyglutaryl-CoA dehydratase subunit BcrC/BadD/HgdB